MAGLVPNFTGAQLKRLRDLGVHAEQVRDLRQAAALTRAWLKPLAGKNDVGEVLDDVAKLSGQLSQRLAALFSQRDAAHSGAHAYIEVAYWAEHPNDEGPTSAHLLCARLDTLTKVAREAKASLPAGPTRHRTADYRPIEGIERALRDGWRRAHGSGVRTSDLPVPIPPAYPRELKPSATEGSAFREICGICYEAAGRGIDADPLRAIREYLRHCVSKRQAAILEFEKDIKVESNKERPAKNRTPRKF